MRTPLLVSILAVIGCGELTEEQGCIAMDDAATSCPAPGDVDLADVRHFDTCDLEAVGMRSTETPEPTSMPFAMSTVNVGCCYDVVFLDATPNSSCIAGRPFLVEGAPLLPAAPAVDNPVAAAWLRLAQAELASVAAFARLQLELLAHGAPIALIERVAAAMADEIDHARRVQAHAEALAGRPLSLGAMPLPKHVEVARSLAAVAADAAREGCVGETVSARMVRVAAEAATDPAWAAQLARIAVDEERHAVLSWAIVVWAVRTGGAEVRSAVAAAFVAPVPVGPMAGFDGAEAAGLLGPAAALAEAEATLAEIVGPALGALLAG